MMVAIWLTVPVVDAILVVPPPNATLCPNAAVTAAADDCLDRLDRGIRRDDRGQCWIDDKIAGGIRRCRGRRVDDEQIARQLVGIGWAGVVIRRLEDSRACR